MKNSLKILQAVLLIFLFYTFVIFLENFLSNEFTYIVPLITIILIGITILFISTIIKYIDNVELRRKKKDHEYLIRKKAIQIVEKKLKEEDKDENITYIEKNKLVEEEIDKIKRQIMV